MMTPRDKALELIAINIKRNGYHVYVVSGGPVPRWAYTIGLSQSLGCELVLAGGALLSKASVLDLIKVLSQGGAWQINQTFADDRGQFALSPVCGSWGAELLAGANDYYSRQVVALQIVPLGALATIEVPDLAHEHVRGEPSAWRWLFEKWPYLNVPPNSEAMVDAHVLRGTAATDVARWEEDYWEVFSSPGVQVVKEDARILPLGALVGSDPSLEILTTLRVGQALQKSKERGMWF